MASGEGPISYFPFVERVLIVVFGVLVATLPGTLIDEELKAQHLLLVTVLLLFVEGYIVLHTYHARLGSRLGLDLMITNLLIIALYVTVVRFIDASTETATCGGHLCLNSAAIIGAIVFVLLFLYQIVLYLNVSNERLQEAGVKRSTLLTPMVADFVGLVGCGALFVVSENLGSVANRADTRSLDVVALVLFAASLIYFVVKYLGVIQVRFGKGPGQ